MGVTHSTYGQGPDSLDGYHANRLNANYYARIYDGHNCSATTTGAEFPISPIIDFACQERCYPANGDPMSIWIDGFGYDYFKLPYIDQNGPLVQLYRNSECSGQNVGIARVHKGSIANCNNIGEGVYSFMPVLPKACNKKLEKHVKEREKAKPPQFVDWHEIKEKKRATAQKVPEEAFNHIDLENAQRQTFERQGRVPVDVVDEVPVRYQDLDWDQRDELRDFLTWKDENIQKIRDGPKDVPHRGVNRDYLKWKAEKEEKERIEEHKKEMARIMKEREQLEKERKEKELKESHKKEKERKKKAEEEQKKEEKAKKEARKKAEDELKKKEEKEKKEREEKEKKEKKQREKKEKEKKEKEKKEKKEREEKEKKEKKEREGKEKAEKKEREKKEKAEKKEREKEEKEEKNKLFKELKEHLIPGSGRWGWRRRA